MTALTVRCLRVDLKPPISRHWNGGDAFRTALFNALSMSFPAGEQFFIDSMRRGMKLLPPAQQTRFADEVQAFIGQEATHRHIHALFNEHLARQGLVNHWEGRIQARTARLQGMDTRNWLAVTAATEHWTAIFAEHLLAHPQLLHGAEPRLRDLWLWHSAEESEHRSTAFDLYLALGGNARWRQRAVGDEGRPAIGQQRRGTPPSAAGMPQPPVSRRTAASVDRHCGAKTNQASSDSAVARLQVLRDQRRQRRAASSPVADSAYTVPSD
jgi:hypothetical protein